MYNKIQEIVWKIEGDYSSTKFFGIKRIAQNCKNSSIKLKEYFDKIKQILVHHEKNCLRVKIIEILCNCSTELRKFFYTITSFDKIMGIAV